ncbi:MAG: Sec-independent protein translocase protein TatB [Pseudomonadota bacterium]
MLDIGWPELLIILIVAVIVIGPKDLPKTMYTVGKWVRAARRMTGQMQRQFDDAMREAELDEIRQGLKKASPNAVKKQIEKTIDPTGTLSKATDLGTGRSVKQYIKEGLTSDDKTEAKETTDKEAPDKETADKETADKEAPDKEAPDEAAPDEAAEKEPHIKGDEGADKVAVAGVQEPKPAKAKAKPAPKKVDGEGADVTPTIKPQATRAKASRRKKAEPVVAAEGEPST